MQLTADWLTDSRTKAAMALLSDAGHQVFAVGGAVRNSLLGQPVSDIDLATDALPEKVVALAQAAGIRAVPTGIDHGTVTLVIDGTPFEVTTFRRDVETDGRRAVVAFSADLNDDARRRDFTMNALYADASGIITDPTGGLDDLAQRHVRFIGDATARIREDYLRTLRFFRFHAWYGDPDAGIDADGLAAIAETLDGLDTLSTERVTAELLRLLAAPDPAPAVATMERVGVLTRLLPAATSEYLAPLVHLAAGMAPDSVLRLAALGGLDLDRLRLSNTDARRFKILRDAATDGTPTAVVGYLHDADMATKSGLLRAALLGQPVSPNRTEEAARGAAAAFPVRAADLMPDLAGPALGAALKRLETDWIASDFALGREELIARR